MSYSNNQFVNPRSQKAQYEQVKDYLKKGNTLTVFEAFVLFNIPNLSQRIQDLREKGFIIDSIPVKHNGRRFVAYRWNENNPTDEITPQKKPNRTSPVETLDDDSLTVADSVSSTSPVEQ